MNPQYFGAIKTRTKGEIEASLKAEPLKRGRKPKPPLVEACVAPPEKPKAMCEPDVLLTLEGFKELVSQFGPDRVKKMVDLLS